MVISLTDFNNLNEKDKRKTLQELKNDIGVSGLVREWNVSRAKIYSLLHELDVPVNPRKPRKSVMTSPGASPGGNENQKSKKRNKDQQEATPEYYEVYNAFAAEVPKFSLSLDTQGEASVISQTIQVLLASGKFENANLHLNLTLEEI